MRQPNPKRSWIASLWEDVKWLAANTQTFGDLDTTSLGPWLCMARDFPKQTAKAVKKVCFIDKAIDAAEARALGWQGASVVPAEVADNDFQCQMCDYRGTRVQVQCHEQREHDLISTITRCVDTAACSVCGLMFDSVLICRRHSRESSICNHNLLLRGPFLSDSDLTASLEEDQAIKAANCKAAKAPMKTKKVCTRTFGPRQKIVDKNGVVIQPAKNGHPLGNGRPLFLPRHLCEASLPFTGSCDAARYMPCTDQCRLCGAAPTVYNGPFRN